MKRIAERILYFTYRGEQVYFKFSDLENEPLFVSPHESDNLDDIRMDILRKLDGHSPVLIYKLDMKKIEDWVEINNLVLLNDPNINRGLIFCKK